MIVFATQEDLIWLDWVSGELTQEGAFFVEEIAGQWRTSDGEIRYLRLPVWEARPLGRIGGNTSSAG